MGNFITTGNIEGLAVKELRVLSPLALAYLYDRLRNPVCRIAITIDLLLNGNEVPQEALEIARESIDEFLEEFRKIG